MSQRPLRIDLDAIEAEGRPSLAALGRFGDDNVGFVTVEIPHLRALLDIAEAALSRERALHVSGDRMRVLTAGDDLAAACKLVRP